MRDPKGRRGSYVLKSVTIYLFNTPLSMKRFVPNEVTAGSYMNITLTFPGGSLTAKRDVLESIFDPNLLPSTCDPKEVTVSPKEYVRTKYAGASPSAIIKKQPYVLKTYGSGETGSAAGGEPIKFLIDGSWWTCRLTGSHQDFMDYLCSNLESLKSDATYWISAKGRKYFVAHSNNSGD